MLPKIQFQQFFIQLNQLLLFHLLQLAYQPFRPFQVYQMRKLMLLNVDMGKNQGSIGWVTNTTYQQDYNILYYYQLFSFLLFRNNLSYPFQKHPKISFYLLIIVFAKPHLSNNPNYVLSCFRLTKKTMISQCHFKEVRSHYLSFRIHQLLQPFFLLLTHLLFQTFSQAFAVLRIYAIFAMPQKINFGNLYRNFHDLVIRVKDVFELMNLGFQPFPQVANISRIKNLCFDFRKVLLYEEVKFVPFL